MPTPPYDNLEAVMNTARARLLDAIVSINGEIVTDTAAFTLPMINVAWRRLQAYLTTRGYPTLIKETLLLNLPAWTSGDPGVFAFLAWNEYWNGSLPTPSIVLPQDLIWPLDLWERQNGSNAIYQPMDQVLNGLPTANPGNGNAPRDVLNRLWEWRADAIWLPGATTNVDLRVRYAAYLADFIASGALAFASQTVPIMRALDSFAWYICAEAARSRGDMDAGYFDQQAEQEADNICARDFRQGRQLLKRAELGKMPDRDSRPAGPNMPAGPQREGLA